MWGFLIGWIVGAVVSGLLTSYFFRRLRIGSLRIDRSDPSEPPYIFLELSKDVGDLSNKAYAIVKVETKNYISHD